MDYLNNPYVPQTLKDYLIAIDRGEVPKQAYYWECDYGWQLEGNSTEYLFFARNYLMDKNIWALVDLNWTGVLANWIGNRFALEVYAGVGWLSKALHQYGINVVATGSYEWIRQRNAKTVFQVEELDSIEAIQAYPDAEILIASWVPPKDKNFSLAMDYWGDKPIVFVGEINGCTGDHWFSENFIVDKVISIPQWDGMHDKCFIGHVQVPEYGMEEALVRHKYPNYY